MVLQWGHGDEAVEDRDGNRWLSTLLCCFNGATAMKPWKTTLARGPAMNSYPLQWGHGDEAVEDQMHSRRN